MIDFDTIKRSSDFLNHHLMKTPMVYSTVLSALSKAEVYLKLENRQPTGSFKVRGAIQKLMSLKKSGIGGPLVAASAGNHALGVALAAEKLGCHQVVIFVPQNCPRPKLEKLKAFAVEVVQIGASYNEAVEAAQEYLKINGGTWISGYDDIEIITGQATAGLEIIEDLPHVDILLLPVGGGGLIAGVSSAVKQLKPEVEIIGLQPTASPAALLSLKNGRAYDPYDHEPTMADGLAGGFGELPLKLCSGLVSDIMLIPENEIGWSVLRLLESDQIVAEPSGAISIAPLLREDRLFDGKRVVCIISGGNLSLSVLKDIFDRYHE